MGTLHYPKIYGLDTLLRAMKVMAILVLFPLSVVGTEDVLVGKCTISLDLKEDIIIQPAQTAVDDAFAFDKTTLVKGPDDAASIYLVEFTERQYSGVYERMLFSYMDFCTTIKSEPLWNGYIANGLAKEGGRKCWGTAFPLGEREREFTKLVMVIAAFQDEALNERLVKTVKAGNVTCPSR